MRLHRILATALLLPGSVLGQWGNCAGTASATCTSSNVDLSGTTGLTWGSGLLTVGATTTGGSLFVNTPSAKSAGQLPKHSILQPTCRILVLFSEQKCLRPTTQRIFPVKWSSPLIFRGAKTNCSANDRSPHAEKTDRVGAPRFAEPVWI